MRTLLGSVVVSTACLVLLPPVVQGATKRSKIPAMAVSKKRDKGCAKGTRFIQQRTGTLRLMTVARDGSLRAAACDVRYGRTVVLVVEGTNRNDAAARLVKRQGSRAVIRVTRVHSRGPSRDPFTTVNFVDLRRGLRIALDEEPYQLRPSGLFLFGEDRGLISVAVDGRQDLLAAAPGGGPLRSFSVAGDAVTVVGKAGARTTASVAGTLARLRVCRPGRAGTADTFRVFQDEAVTGVRVWTDEAGVGRACPSAPTGEVRLPCGVGLGPDTPGAPRLTATAIAAGRVVAHCAGQAGGDTLTFLDPVARITTATIPLGGSGLQSAIAVSPDGLVAYTGRADGAGGPDTNVLSLAAPDGQGARVIAQAGVLVRNVRFTAPRTLAWTEIDRVDGPPLGKTADV